MVGRKQLLANTMHRLGILRPFKRWGRRRLVVVTYHRIRPDDASFSTPFAEDVYGCTASDLDRQISWLARNVRILDEAQAIEHMQRGEGPGELSVLITFDDGYRDNFDLAYPILRRHGAPAIFFVPTNMIESRRLGWVDLIAYFLKATAKTSITVDGQQYDLRGDGRARAIMIFHGMKRTRPAAETSDLLDRLAEASAVEPPSPEQQSAELMTWDQLREASAGVVTVGSHTHTHQVLATLDPKDQRDDLDRSRQMIEAELGHAPRTLAYPVGGYRHFNADTRREAQGSGFEMGFSFLTGFNTWGRISAFDVKRMAAAQTLPMLAGGTILPELFSWRGGAMTDQLQPH